MRRVLAATAARLSAASTDHLGNPYNLLDRDPAPGFGGCLVNNLGDHYAGSHFSSQVFELEREAVAWLMHIWGCDAPENY